MIYFSNGDGITFTASMYTLKDPSSFPRLVVFQRSGIAIFPSDTEDNVGEHHPKGLSSLGFDHALCDHLSGTLARLFDAHNSHLRVFSPVNRELNILTPQPRNLPHSFRGAISGALECPL